MTIISLNHLIDKHLKDWKLNKQGYPYKDLPKKEKNSDSKPKNTKKGRRGKKQ